MVSIVEGIVEGFVSDKQRLILYKILMTYIANIVCFTNVAFSFTITAVTYCCCVWHHSVTDSCKASDNISHNIGIMLQIPVF